MRKTWFETVVDALPVPTFWAIFSIRLINSLTINTFFQADEYWQALEPAHRAIFGYGYLTWEWQLGLRSYLHPLLYMLPYWVTKRLNFDYNAVLNAPKLMNALIAAAGEYYLYYLMLNRLKNPRISKLISYLSILSVWNWYCWCRSFANSLELSLTIVSFYYLETESMVRCLVLAALACLIRPTNSVVWFYCLPAEFIKHPKNVMIAILVAIFSLGFDCAVNYYFYSEFKFPLFNFFKFNISDSLSSFYGVSRVDFYLFQAIPIILLNYLPFFIYGILTTAWSNFKGLMLFYIGVFTLISHKEFRFIYPLMPILLYYTADGLISISKRTTDRIMKLIVTLTVFTSIILAVYFTRYHEVGEIEITNVLHRLGLRNKEPISVGFLTPCHSTPFQSHIHLSDEQAHIWFLTCEPPLLSNRNPGVTVAEYMDESDYFYQDPLEFIRKNFPEIITPNSPINIKSEWPHQWPTYLVLFDDLWRDENIKSVLAPAYKTVERLWNSPFHWDSRRRGDLILLEYRSEGT